MTQYHESNYPNLGLDPNLIFSHAPSVTTNTIGYINPETSVEANITTSNRDGHYVISSYEDEDNDNTTLENSLIKILGLTSQEKDIDPNTREVLRAINVIARGLNITLELIT